MKSLLRCTSLLMVFAISCASAQTLQQAVSQTIQTNPNILVKVKGWLAAEQGIKIAQSAYFPAIDVEANFGAQRARNSLTNFGYNNVTARGARIALHQMLFDGFATSNQVASSRSLSLAQKYAAVDVANNIALLATRAYLNILKYKQLLSINRDYYRWHRQIYRLVQRQRHHRRTDLAQTYGRLAQSRAKLLAAQAKYNDAKTAYLKIIGTMPLKLIMPKAPDLKLLLLPKNELGAIQLAVTNHPALQSVNSRIEEALANLHATKAPYLPRVEGVLSAAHDRDIDGVKGKYNDYAAKLELKYNLFRGGADRARATQAAFLVEQAKQNRDYVYRQVIENMKLAWNNLATAKKQLPSLAKHRKAALTTVHGYYRQYKKQHRVLVDLLNAENELLTASSDYINGKYRLFYSKFRILNATGDLLQYMKIPLFAKQPAPPKPVVKAKAVKLQPKAYIQKSKVGKKYTVTSKKLAPGVEKKYTIQLYNSYNKADVINYITANNLQQKAAFYKTRSLGRDKYVVIIGAYSSSQQALATLKALPKALQTNPEIRSLADVQKEMHS